MAIEIIDTVEVANREKKRTVVMNTRKLHSWVHYYPKPGDHDELHCHNEDQTFFCIDGECTSRSYSETMLTRSRKTALIVSCQGHRDRGK